MSKIKLNDLLGDWEITSMEAWDDEYIHIAGKSKIKFLENGGVMNFGYVFGLLDYRICEDNVDFSWNGDDEGEEVSGRGYLTINDKMMEGKVFFHFGEESKFTALKITL